MIRAIIIDDELDGRQAIQMAIEKYCPEVEIRQICESPEQGLEAIRKIMPDLVFLDVQMPAISGFDLLQQLAPVTFEVIFVTAYDQYAIKAIKFSALDYLLKPIDVTDLTHAVEKVKERIHQTGGIHRYQSVLNNIHYQNGAIDKIAVPSADGIEFYAINDIIYCKSKGSYTTLYMKNNRKQLVSRNLKDFEDMLTGSGFCRVHHSYLINMKHIQKYCKGEGGYVILSDGYHVDISRRRKDEFLKILDRV